MDPCGTPEPTLSHEELVSLITTLIQFIQKCFANNKLSLTGKAGKVHILPKPRPHFLCWKKTLTVSLIILVFALDV